MRSVRFVSAAFAAASLILFVSLGRAADAPTPAPAGTASITGKVLDPAGKPAANAKVVLYGSGAMVAPKPAPTAVTPTADAPAGGKKAKPKPVGTTTTGEDGTFKFENLAAGDYTVSIRAKGVGSAMEHISVKDGEAKNIDLTLAKKAK